MFQLGLSVSAYVLGKCDNTVWMVMTYIYIFICVQRYAVSLLPFFNPSFCNSVQSELKCKTGMKKPVPLAFYHIDSWCLVPFSSNISCDRPQSISVLARIRTRVSYISQRYYVVIFQWSTQQENSATKQTFTRHSSDWNAMHSKWGFIPRNDLLLLQTARHICEGNERLTVARWNKKHTRFLSIPLPFMRYIGS